MEKTKKITKKEVATNLKDFMEMQNENGLEMVGNVTIEDVINYLENEINLLEKKSNSNSKGKLHKEQEILIELVYNELKKINRKVTATELLNASEELQNFKLESGLPMSLNKVSAMLKKLVDTDRVSKVVDKRKTYFSVEEV